MSDVRSIAASEWHGHQDTQWWFREPQPHGKWKPVVRTYRAAGGRWFVETGVAAMFSWINQEHYPCGEETLLHSRPRGEAQGEGHECRDLQL